MSAGDKRTDFRESLAALGERRVRRLIGRRAWSVLRLEWAQAWLSEQPGAVVAAALEEKARVRRVRWLLALPLALSLALALLVWAIVA